MTLDKTFQSICVFSGNRADFGPLEPVIYEAANSEQIELSVIINAAHSTASLKALCDVYELNLSVDNETKLDVVQEAAKAITQVGSYLEKIQPDWIIILGDRFEALAAAQAAIICHVPIAHICGGDRSLGSFDDRFRDAITQLSDLHFVTHGAAKTRVEKMGANSSTVFNVGHPSLSVPRLEERMSREEIFRDLGLKNTKTILACFHSLTAQDDMGAHEFDEFADALKKIVNEIDVQVICTAANSDPFGNSINENLKTLASKYDNIHFQHTLGNRRFFAMLKYADLFMGNSSAILYEAPAIGIHALDIGSRQKGRVRPSSVGHSKAESKLIVSHALLKLVSDKPQRDNFFGDGSSAQKIVETLLSMKKTV